MTRIVHLSDIHFGRSFDLQLWERVREKIVQFQPSIVIVSGDVVDSPKLLELLAVKAELLQLCAECAQAELVVVPGNHDTRDYGNFSNKPLSKLFEKVFFCDTTNAFSKVEKRFGIKLGLNAETAEVCSAMFWKDLRGPIDKLGLWIWDSECDGRMQSCAYHKASRVWPIKQWRSGISIVSFNSNSRASSDTFATGEISRDQLLRAGLRNSPGSIKKCASCNANGRQHVWGGGFDALKIGVLHHHPVPVTQGIEAHGAVRRENALEPFLVLRNAGDFLSMLQQEKFDLVLYGHKHRPQRTRVELGIGSLESYPITLVGSGSCAKRDELKPNNTLQLIFIEPNSRLNIQVIKNAGVGGVVEAYREPIEYLKRRAFARAIERCGRVSAEIEWKSRVDIFGNLHNEFRYQALQALAHGKTITGVPLKVEAPADGVRFREKVQPVPGFENAIRVKWVDDSGQVIDEIPVGNEVNGGRYFFEFVEPLQTYAPEGVNFAVKFKIANSMAMTQWELKRRPSSDFRHDRETHEFTWRYIGEPTRRLVMRLRLPDEFLGVEPEVRCYRHKDYPNFPRTYELGPESKVRLVDLIVDEQIQAEESRFLRYSSSSNEWILLIDYPLPGYAYELRWKVPNPIADNRVCDQTRGSQKAFIRSYRRSVEGECVEQDRLAREEFSELLAEIWQRVDERFSDGEARESYFAVFDDVGGTLQTVMIFPHAKQGPELPAIPLGKGVMGTAFLRRRFARWSRADGASTLIRPRSLTDFRAAHILAIPVFHRSGTEITNSPGAVIGVLGLASSAEGSGLGDPSLDDDLDKSTLVSELQNAAQMATQRSLARLLVKG